jgi:hypothetical protein
VDEDDFRALIEVLAQQLAAIGEGDIADERHYVQSFGDPDTEARLLQPREHLIAMLEAFERFLSVQDRATYTESLADLSQFLADSGPRAAFIEQAGITPEANPLRLSDAPDLASVRHDVLHLIHAIREDGGERPRSGP